MTSFLAFLGAAFAEIAGCFSFWMWIKLHKPWWWIAPGMLSLALFAYLLTLVESDYAGRSYAAYGAIYICASIGWMWVIENNTPNKFDILGVLICLAGAGIIMFSQK